MIKANDLRIGNWISFRNFISDDKYVQVNARFFCSLAGGRSITDLKFDEEINNYYQPIPLTPERLLKSRWDNEDEYYVLRGEDFWIREIGNNKFSFVSGISRIGEPFYFVHQLQNLYYCLTGEELQINL